MNQRDYKFLRPSESNDSSCVRLFHGVAKCPINLARNIGFRGSSQQEIQMRGRTVDVDSGGGQCCNVASPETPWAVGWWAGVSHFTELSRTLLVRFSASDGTLQLMHRLPTGYAPAVYRVVYTFIHSRGSVREAGRRLEIYVGWTLCPRVRAPANRRATVVEGAGWLVLSYPDFPTVYPPLAHTPVHPCAHAYRQAYPQVLCAQPRQYAFQDIEVGKIDHHLPPPLRPHLEHHRRRQLVRQLFLQAHDVSRLFLQARGGG
jgi:hypothetical protein